MVMKFNKQQVKQMLRDANYPKGLREVSSVMTETKPKQEGLYCHHCGSGKVRIHLSVATCENCGTVFAYQHAREL